MDKEEQNKRDILGAPLVDTIVVRIPRRLLIFLKGVAITEKTDPSKIARRLMITTAIEEGFDPEGY